MNLHEMQEGILYISTLNPRFEVHKKTSAAWLKLFSEMELDDFLKLVDQFTKTTEHNFPPSAQELYKIHRENKKQEIQKSSVFISNQEPKQAQVINQELRTKLDDFYKSSTFKPEEEK